MNSASIQPVAVTDQRASQLLRIEWADGAVSELPHGLLRTIASVQNAWLRSAQGKPWCWAAQLLTLKWWANTP